MSSDGAEVRPSVDAVYQVLHERIRAKDEVSFKLLSLVPLISGVGISILVKADIAWGLRCFVSVFGATVTFGIFRWELRNIQWCDELMIRANTIENVTNPDPPWLRVPLFRRRFVGKTEAELILYLAVILAWLFLPGVDAVVRPKGDLES